MADAKNNGPFVRENIVRITVVAGIAVGLCGGYFLSASHASQAMKNQDHLLAVERTKAACQDVSKLKNATPKIGKLPMTPPPIVGKSLTGQDVDLAALKGKWVLVNFWATWCKTCKQEKPFLIDYTTRGDNLAVISVVTGSEWEKVKQMQVGNLPFPVIADAPQNGAEYGPIANAYQITGVPETFVIGPDGQLHYHFIGKVFWDWIGQSIARCGLPS